MIFGDAVEAAESVFPAAWIAGERPGTWGTVGSLIPDRYPSIVRVSANDPDPDTDNWWPVYRDLFGTIAEIGARHTSTPDRAWFAVWEGQGFGTATTTATATGTATTTAATTATAMIAWPDPPPDEATRREHDAERERVRQESDRQNAAIGSALGDIPRVDLPHRAYYLLAGPVTATTALSDPTSVRDPDRWQRPDLFWPDDRRWFVATDVDFWSLYIGGDATFVAEIHRAVPTPTESVTSADRLVVED